MYKFFKKVVQRALKMKDYKIINLNNSLQITRTSKCKIELLIEKLYPYKVDTDLIRIGPKGDGGYLVPNDLEGIIACFSPGVDLTSGFEEDCFNLGMQIFLADRSIEKPNLNLSSDKYNFLCKYVGWTNNEDFITIDEWVNSAEIDKNSDLLLQMDIEGAEYFTVLNMSDSILNRFRIIIIEFHQLHNLWNSGFYTLAIEVFNKILQTHTCVHIHPNNNKGIDSQLGIEIPRLAEFTFLRNDRILNKEYQNEFPNKLDVDNTNKAHIFLPQNWYKKAK